MFFFLLFSSFSIDESLFNSLSIYQVMVSSFQDGDPYVGHGVGYGPSAHNGDLQGIINALDYIKDLGFNAIWMTPIFDSRGTRGNDLKLRSTGYAPTDYFNIDPNFGTNDKFRELVNAAHNKGIYVILDGVFGHHGGSVKASPNGKYPYDKPGYEAQYPESLAFFCEVAQYWIENYEIDGWRLDVAKELIQDGTNYLTNIRLAVEEVSDKRRNQGKQWGILGYVVGEYWDTLDNIRDNVYSSLALRSAFDFPFRFNIVQSLAQDEDGKTESSMINAISDVHRTPFEKTYGRDDIYPNLFISNHDLYRFGNLLRLKHEISINDDNYWRYHKIAIGTLAVFSGPITLYYGDELGDIADCWNGEEANSCENTERSRTEKQNNARTDGHISNFTPRQTDLHDYTREIMNARLKHPSMWRGTNGKTTQGDVYFNCKYDPVTGDKVVLIINFGNSQNTVSYQVGGIKLYDLFTKEVIYSYEEGKYKIPLDPLGTRIFQVFDEDVEVTVTVAADCAAQQEVVAAEQAKNAEKKVIAVIAIASVVVVVVIVVAVIVVIRMRRKFIRELSDTKSNPLVDMSL